jgi:hypothetical protein
VAEPRSGNVPNPGGERLGYWQSLAIVESLRGLARANWYEFATRPWLCRRYRENLTKRRHRYVADRITCGLADCWSSYLILVTRYQSQDPTAPIPLDCEDCTCAHMGWLASQCYRGPKLYVGLVPGVKVSHAVGRVVQDGKDHIVDPSRWFGMGPTSYDGAVWLELTPR